MQQLLEQQAVNDRIARLIQEPAAQVLKHLLGVAGDVADRMDADLQTPRNMDR